MLIGRSPSYQELEGESVLSGVSQTFPGPVLFKKIEEEVLGRQVSKQSDFSCRNGHVKAESPTK